MLSEEDILKIGSFLEHDGMGDAEIDGWFEHAGVRGMKWGIRKPRKGTNVVTDAKIDINDRRIYRTQHRQKSDAYRVSAAAGKVLLGGAARQKRMQNTKIAKLMEQNKRLKSNKLSGKDKWGAYGSIPIKLLVQGIWPGPFTPMRGPSPLGLLISRKPKTKAELAASKKN